MYIHIWKNEKRGVIPPRTSTLACVHLTLNYISQTTTPAE